MQETYVRSLGQEDPVEKEMATHSSILAWEISYREEPGGYNPWGHKESDTTERLRFHFHFQAPLPQVTNEKLMAPKSMDLEGEGWQHSDNM